MALVNWRITATTFQEWRHLMDLVYDLDPNTDEAYELREQIRSLPGFPNNYDEIADVITVEVIDASGSYSIPEPTVIITGGSIH